MVGEQGLISFPWPFAERKKHNLMMVQSSKRLWIYNNCHFWQWSMIIVQSVIFLNITEINSTLQHYFTIATNTGHCFFIVSCSDHKIDSSKCSIHNSAFNTHTIPDSYEPLHPRLRWFSGLWCSQRKPKAFCLLRCWKSSVMTPKW